MNLVRIIGDILLFIFLCSPADAVLAPYPLDEMGFLSPEYYFMAERDPQSITVNTLEGKKVSTIANPGGHLCCPCMHPDVADMVFYASATGTPYDLKWRIHKRNLSTGSDSIAISKLIDLYPFNMNAVGSKVGLIIYSCLREMNLFQPPECIPKRLAPAGMDKLRVDIPTGKAWWFYSSSPDQDCEYVGPSLESMTLYSLDMQSGATDTVEIPLDGLRPPAHRMTFLTQQGKSLTLLAYCSFEEGEGSQTKLCQFDMETSILTDKRDLQDLSVTYSAYPWVVLSKYDDKGCSRTDTFVNLESNESITGIEGKVYGLMLGNNGNPIVLTDTGVYVLPPRSKILKKMYEVMLPDNR